MPQKEVGPHTTFVLPSEDRTGSGQAKGIHFAKDYVLE